MPIKNWKKEIFTIPNLLSLMRMLLIPVYIRIYMGASYLLAGGILTISCLTDFVDGWIARRFNMISAVGKLLDPLADKLTQLALILCLSVKYPVLYPVLVLFLVKEVFQIAAVIVHYHRGKALPGALMAGKVCTTILFISLMVFVFFPNMKQTTAIVLAITDSCFLVFSFYQYILAYYGAEKKILDI